MPHDTPSPAITRRVIKLTPPGLNVPIELVLDDIDWARLMMALDDAAAPQNVKLYWPLPRWPRPGDPDDLPWKSTSGMPLARAAFGVLMQAVAGRTGTQSRCWFWPGGSAFRV